MAVPGTRRTLGIGAGQRDALTARLFEATLGAFDLMSVMLGLDLGYYRALVDGGPATAMRVELPVGRRRWIGGR